jgi:hypothetical protein
VTTPRSLRDAAGRAAILDRLGRLTPQHARRWGKMRPDQLLPHLGDGLKLALGELKRGTGKQKRGIGAWLWRYLAIHRLPWPEGKIQSPSGAFETGTEGFEPDRTKVIQLIERFAVATPDQFAVEHPAFGRMAPRDWDVLQYRHFDHHLRQFGA